MHMSPFPILSLRHTVGLHAAVLPALLGRPSPEFGDVAQGYCLFHGLGVLDEIFDVLRPLHGFGSHLCCLLVQATTAGGDANAVTIDQPIRRHLLEQCNAAAQDARGRMGRMARVEKNIGEEHVPLSTRGVRIYRPRPALALAPQGEGVEVSMLKVMGNHVVVLLVACMESAAAGKGAYSEAVLPELLQGSKLLGQQVETDVVRGAHRS
mmetsp:Transcript_8039/g.16947  ORF Transcript_8039/g.16947 Transcript_8039/m.16947 type:complete len:209 (-) Transcript_8039:368-994(-)